MSFMDLLVRQDWRPSTGRRRKMKVKKLGDNSIENGRYEGEGFSFTIKGFHVSLLKKRLQVSIRKTPTHFLPVKLTLFLTSELYF